MGRLTVKELLDLKGRKKLALTTAFDYNTAKAADIAGIDLIVTWGQVTDTMDELVITLGEVRRGAPNTMIGAGVSRADAYTSESEAIKCAMAALEHGADVIYCSGLELSKVKALARQRIPYVGHVGLVPVHSTWFGGLRAVGKTCDEAIKVYTDTLAFQEAGAIAVEMECVPREVAKEITRKTDILTFSMGSGGECDGQFIFSCDLLGSHDLHYPRHAIKYCNFFEDSINAFKSYKSDIDHNIYPGVQHSIEITNEEFEKFLEMLNK